MVRDVENKSIGNHETKCDANIKVMGYYDNKEKLQKVLERYALETSFQYKMTRSTKSL